jgi:hypothetical protein
MSDNPLNKLREEFSIPDSVVIVTEKNLFPPGSKSPAGQPKYNIDQTDTRDPELYRSPLGTPVYADITFMQGSYTENIPQNRKQTYVIEEVVGEASGVPIIKKSLITGRSITNEVINKSYGPLTCQAVLITVSQSKKIIKTEIQGRNGTVKEYLGLDDYKVTINGIITGPNGHYPIEIVNGLKAMLDSDQPIEVASKFLQNLGIHSIVVESYDIPQKEGGYSYQTFSIECISDVPQELKFINV